MNRYTNLKIHLTEKTTKGLCSGFGILIEHAADDGEQICTGHQ